MDGDNVIFFFTADEETAKSLLDSIMKAMDMQSDDAQQEINLKSLSGEYTVNKDGYLIGQKIDLSCEVTQDDVTSSADVTMNLSLVNPGQAVEITVEDPDSYQDASDSSIDSLAFLMMPPAKRFLCRRLLIIKLKKRACPIARGTLFSYSLFK